MKRLSAKHRGVQWGLVLALAVLMAFLASVTLIAAAPSSAAGANNQDLKVRP